jgi:hypothetical protein
MHTTDLKTLDSVIQHMKKDLVTLKARKKRADKGTKRKTYSSNLPGEYRRYLNRANKRGLVFELTVLEFDFIRSKPCVFCGVNSKIGIDRRDSSDGYTLDNCQPACGTCNMMKFTLEEENFLRHINKIYNHRLT